MTCVKVAELLEDYVLGQLSLEEEKKVNEHLKHCPACKKEYLALKRLTEELHQWSGRIEMPKDLEKKIENIILEEAKSRTKLPRAYKNALTYAAAAALLFSVSWGVWSQTDLFIKDDPVPMQQAAPKEDLASMQRAAEQGPARGFDGHDSLELFDYGDQDVPPDLETPVSNEVDGVKDAEMVTMALDSPMTAGPEGSIQQPFIPPHEVQSIVIDRGGDIFSLPKDEENQGIVDMLVQGVNEAEIVENTEKVNDRVFKQQIYIQLADGSKYQILYNGDSNKALVDGVLIVPGPALSEALEALLTN
ncbi:anti-sigma factor family protein [Desulfofalx alkaliphila]|uniref:anti-sigma factor family protein n=1 Tax=Desulfofalx alkaliphila TaxID=105483 RepID=UPI0004E0EDF9|nr:zf-HC2 domain-containing protein [Desulfofalx alkaliphila]